MVGNVACAKRDRSEIMVFYQMWQRRNSNPFLFVLQSARTFGTIFIPLKHREAGAHTIPAFFRQYTVFFFNSFLASIQKFIVSFFIDLVFSGCSLAWAARTQNLFREITIYCIGNTYGVCVHTLHISCWCRRRRSPSIDSSSFSMLRFGIWIERTRALDVRPRNAERTKCWAASSKNVKIEMHASVFDVRTPRFLIYL